jgi:hypothetical protein
LESASSWRRLERYYGISVAIRERQKRNSIFATPWGTHQRLCI